jgi:ssDNA-binding Zn-finger/Zn-ribbon topoisomerase 1
MEKRTDKIADGKLTYLEVMNEFYSKFKDELKSAYTSYNFELCPNCGSALVKRDSKFGKSFFGCSSYPSCKYIKNI